MDNSSANNKIIAKNALLLYVRMFFTIFIGLYTSRIVMQALGFSDYGIYNLVGGIVSMLAFLNVGMAGASQRFISYELGNGTLESLKNIFCNSVITHNIIAFIAILIFETFGIWLVNYKLVIPTDRLFAANWVFQCSIITFAISVISVPYSSCVIAHEKMGQFAYISILEAVLKLLIAFLISISSFDKLIIYATLLLTVQLFIRYIYIAYCKREFKECTYKFSFDKKLFRQMFSFAAWGGVGNMGFSLKDQLSNFVLNLFFGVTINAARGIASQVNGIINGFAGNFTMALNPQITKQYASGNIDRSKNLAIFGSKYAFFLLSMVAIPFLINEHYLLRLWLGNIPEYTDIFVCITVIASCVYSMSHTISTAILATGHVKCFQSLLAGILLAEIPIAYYLLKIGCQPYMAILPSVFTNLLSIIFRIILIHRYVPEYCIKDYIGKVVIRCLAIFSFCYMVSWYIHSLFPDTLLSVIITGFISLLITTLAIYCGGLSKTERKMITSKIFNKIRK